MSEQGKPRPPLPPFEATSAAEKVRMAEDAWNTRSPERVALAYTRDNSWRNRSEFFSGREAIVQFLASDQMPEGERGAASATGESSTTLLVGLRALAHALRSQTSSEGSAATHPCPEVANPLISA